MALLLPGYGIVIAPWLTPSRLSPTNQDASGAFASRVDLSCLVLFAASSHHNQFNISLIHINIAPTLMDRLKPCSLV
jgi:hypothetical protein